LTFWRPLRTSWFIVGTAVFSLPFLGAADCKAQKGFACLFPEPVRQSAQVAALFNDLLIGMF
jgi:hypothetical protein